MPKRIPFQKVDFFGNVSGSSTWTNRNSLKRVVSEVLRLRQMLTSLDPVWCPNQNSNRGVNEVRGSGHGQRGAVEGWCSEAVPPLRFIVYHIHLSAIWGKLTGEENKMCTLLLGEQKPVWFYNQSSSTTIENRANQKEKYQGF